ncbi:MAG: hypothetical protein LBV17_02190, partial [Treponema sp.]|nr:hypothetical protein [Treponema sp.]
PLWGVSKNVPLTRYVGMYPETNTLPKQPYPVRSAAGLVDFFTANQRKPRVVREVGCFSDTTLQTFS